MKFFLSRFCDRDENCGAKMGDWRQSDSHLSPGRFVNDAPRFRERPPEICCQISCCVIAFFVDRLMR